MRSLNWSQLTTIMISRRKFIAQTTCLAAGSMAFAKYSSQATEKLMTVQGWVNAEQAGFSLTHEHVLVDFIGAGEADPSRYNADEVFKLALPQLRAAQERGCKTFMECTPAYLGRDVKLLQRLSGASGIHILTNTGYYGAAGEKYLPAHAYTETATELAARWIKTVVDKYPLSVVQQKLVEAAALTHLQTGLSIGIHTGNGEAAMEELKIISAKGIKPDAWIWIHAQNEQDRQLHYKAAKAGGWVSFDGVNSGSLSSCIRFLRDMKNENLLHRVLLSHDSGWYHVGEPNGGNYNDYNTIMDKLIPALKETEFTEADIRLLFTSNPAKTFAVNIRRR
jgi:predicted metal-dependent phosphotriesterase family hydrolase